MVHARRYLLVPAALLSTLVLGSPTDGVDAQQPPGPPGLEAQRAEYARRNPGLQGEAAVAAARAAAIRRGTPDRARTAAELGPPPPNNLPPPPDPHPFGPPPGPIPGDPAPRRSEVSPDPLIGTLRLLSVEAAPEAQSGISCGIYADAYRQNQSIQYARGYMYCNNYIPYAGAPSWQAQHGYHTLWDGTREIIQEQIYNCDWRLTADGIWWGCPYDGYTPDYLQCAWTRTMDYIGGHNGYSASYTNQGTWWVNGCQQA